MLSSLAHAGGLRRLLGSAAAGLALMAALPAQAQTCMPVSTNGCGSGTYLDVVNLSGGLNYTSFYNSDDCNGASDGYISYPTSQYTATVHRDEAYSLFLRNGPNAAYLLAWIDFDHDGIFSTGEGVSTFKNGGDGYSFNIAVPSNAVLGPTAMRVRAVSNTSGSLFYVADACTSSDFGETEDYTIEVGPNVLPKPCIPKMYSNCTESGNDTTWNAIENVVINTLSNLGTGCNGNPDNYILYPASVATTTLQPGSTYSFTMTPNAGPPSHVGAVYFD